MDAPIITFNISAAAMSTIGGSELYQNHRYDGTDNSRRAGEALSSARSRKMGKGYTYVVTCDVRAADVIWDYCSTVGQTFCMEADPETRRDGRALLAARDLIAKAIAATGWTAPTDASPSQPPAGAAEEQPQQRKPEQPEVPELMSQTRARQEAAKRNARGEVELGTTAVAAPYPPESWGGEEEGWVVTLVPTGDHSTPSFERRNHTPLRDGKNWSGKPGEFALLGGVGEPVRTWADMRWALAEQLKRYLSRFPDPAGAVDDALAEKVAALVVGDHYVVPGTVVLTREHVLKYVELARAKTHA